MIVKCIKDCFDSKRNRRYFAGDQDDVDPLEPVAMYFEFPVGTEVYFKQRGTKTTPAVSTTRIVGGAVVEQKDAIPEVKTEAVQEYNKEIICDICGVYKGRPMQVKTHRRACEKKANAQTQQVA